MLKRDHDRAMKQTGDMYRSYIAATRKLTDAQISALQGRIELMEADYAALDAAYVKLGEEHDQWARRAERMIVYLQAQGVDTQQFMDPEPVTLPAHVDPACTCTDGHCWDQAALADAARDEEIQEAILWRADPPLWTQGE